MDNEHNMCLYDIKCYGFASQVNNATSLFTDPFWYKMVCHNDICFTFILSNATRDNANNTCRYMHNGYLVKYVLSADTKNGISCILTKLCSNPDYKFWIHNGVDLGKYFP